MLYLFDGSFKRFHIRFSIGGCLSDNRFIGRAGLVKELAGISSVPQHLLQFHRVHAWPVQHASRDAFAWQGKWRNRARLVF